MLKKITNNSILKNIAVFFSGSLIALTATVGIQFFLPKILSVEDYGLYKSFALYLSYTSLLHFGLKDGIYIALCSEQVFDKNKNVTFYSVLLAQQAIVLVLMLGGSFFFDVPLKIVLICLAITSFFFIVNTYYDSLFQSQKDFRTVSILKIFKESSFLLLLIVVYFIFENPSVIMILSSFLISIVLTFIVYTFFSRKWIGLKSITRKEIESVKPVYFRGFNLITGNFGHQINTNIDKLFINFFYSVELFAYYSFGGMFFVLTNTFISSIATVLLPYLLKEYKQDLDKKHKQLMRITSLFSVVLFFYLIAVFFFVKFFYPEYVTSIPIIALFYIGMVYSIKINIVQNNYLKTLNLDKEYIRNNYIILFVFILTMVILYLSKVEVSYFALTTSIMMFLRCKLNLKSINTKLESVKMYFIDDFIIFILGILIFLYSQFVA